MADIPFHQTRMGQRFLEATLPQLVRQLERLNDNLEQFLVEKNPEPDKVSPAAES